MRYSLAIAAVLAFIATGSIAQAQNPPAQAQNPPAQAQNPPAQAQNPPAKDRPQNSAVNSPDSSNRQVTAPVSGRNSFTEGEAKSRIEKMGFSNATNLKKDDNGVWRGRATKDGKTVDVSVDYQGNVIQAGAQGTTAPSNAAQGGSRR